MIKGLISLVIVATGLLGAGSTVAEFTRDEFEPPHNWELSSYVPVVNSIPGPVRSVVIYSIVPKIAVSYGDERREPLPKPKLPAYRIDSPEWRCDQWMDLARRVGWTEDELPKLSYTIYRESRCFSDRHNPDDPMGGSSGLMQINKFWCKPTRYWPGGWLQAQGILEHCDELFDPETNLRAGLAIRENSGWSPWGFRK